MAVLLVRHAEAGDRERWGSPDHLRPLTPEGAAQAEALVRALADFEVRHVRSSPYLRCSQTVAPLAAARGLPVEPTGDLAEGQGEAGLALVRGALGMSGETVLCTHGDVVEEVLDALGIRRAEETGKGATWVLTAGEARCIAAPG